jgi:hypothetical protein
MDAGAEGVQSTNKFSMTFLSNAPSAPASTKHFSLSYCPQNVPASAYVRVQPPPLPPQTYPFPTNPGFQGAEALNFLHFQTAERRRARDALAPQAAMPLRKEA